MSRKQKICERTRECPKEQENEENSENKPKKFRKDEIISKRTEIFRLLQSLVEETRKFQRERWEVENFRKNRNLSASAILSGRDEQFPTGVMGSRERFFLQGSLAKFIGSRKVLSWVPSNPQKKSSWCCWDLDEKAPDFSPWSNWQCRVSKEKEHNPVVVVWDAHQEMSHCWI